MTWLATSILDDAVLARLDLWWVVFVVPVLVALDAYGGWRRASALRALASTELARRFVATVAPENRVLKAVFTTLAAGLVAFGLLRPQYGGVVEVVPVGGLDVVLVVDYSKSMLADDVYPTRNERLEAELDRFLDDAERRGDRVGLVVFAGMPRGLPLTRDSRLLRLYLDRADPRTERPGGTAIAPALELALEFLREARVADSKAGRAEADQVIVLLTDGEDTSGGDARAVAAEAAKLDVRVYAVGIGSASGTPVPKVDERGEIVGVQTDDAGKIVMTRLDDALLRDLAAKTGGAALTVTPEAFGLDEVREQMKDLSRAQREDTLTVHRQEGYVVVILPALVLLTLALALGERRRRVR
jgi:Ca-activated chloride channel family protein